ncbi:MAG: hypothetical protein NT018_05410 [Armatimonadetes bacterium]|nr:hypothetical protein [Armatimonadota bacterium]
MTSKYPVIDLTQLRTMSIKDRKSKVDVADFAAPHKPGSGMRSFLDSLPDIFAGRMIRTVINRIADAHKSGKPVIVTMGAHVIKCGLSPMLCDLMRRGVITALAVNGAGAIHDSEIAKFGQTSEDVVDGMRTGMFGMADETADFLNNGARVAMDVKLGFGEALGRALIAENAPNASVSLLATAYECNVPLTVHACIGCDIVHMHSSADGSAIGDASMRDFRILTQAMRNLGGGGVLANLGSAVVLPEVVLKALNMLINLGCDMKGMYGVNLDFVQQYRSNMQVVSRVKEMGGDGCALTGHHEIMIPLIAAGVIERLEGNR